MQRDQDVRIDKKGEGGKVSGRGVRRRGVLGKRSHGDVCVCEGGGGT